MVCINRPCVFIAFYYLKPVLADGEFVASSQSRFGVVLCRTWALVVYDGRMQVSENYKYATYAFGGLLVLQFLWWNKKAPEVLKLGGGY